MRSILICTAALSLTLAGCSQSGEQLETGATDDTVAPTAETGTAETFVRGLYAALGTPAGVTSLTDEAGPGTWSTATWSKIEADRAAAGGEMGAIDFEPLCHCQDDGGLRLLSVETRSTGPTTTDAVVTLSDEAGGITGLTLKLVQEADGWRVDDVQPDGDPGVLSLLGG